MRSDGNHYLLKARALRQRWLPSGIHIIEGFDNEVGKALVEADGYLAIAIREDPSLLEAYMEKFLINLILGKHQFAERCILMAFEIERLSSSEVQSLVKLGSLLQQQNRDPLK